MLLPGLSSLLLPGLPGLYSGLGGVLLLLGLRLRPSLPPTGGGDWLMEKLRFLCGGGSPRLAGGLMEKLRLLCDVGVPRLAGGLMEKLGLRRIGEPLCGFFSTKSSAPTGAGGTAPCCITDVDT